MTINRNLSFLAEGVSSTGVLGATYGGTGLTSLTAGYIPYGNGTNAFSSNAGLYTNGTQLGIGSTTTLLGAYTANTVGTDGYYIQYGGSSQIASFTANASTGEVRIGATNVSGTFYTTFYSNAAERMRISSSGGVSIGNTTDPGATNLSVAGNIFSGSPTGVNATTYGAKISAAGKLEISQNGSGSTFDQYIKSAGTLQYFLVNGSIVGSISATTSLTLYNTTSDYRLKNVIGAVTNSGERIDALKPIEYDWKTGGRTRGFLAHQFAEVYPSSVCGEKDAIDADGNPVYQAMQASSSEVMADLIAEIQSLRARLKAANIA